MIQIKKLKPKIVKKGWGTEKWICNNEEFCGKMLNINKNSEFSFHYHINKREVFYVQSGLIKLDYFNLSNGQRYSIFLRAGDILEIPRNCPHKVKAIVEAVIIEFSTHHEDSDSYRIEKGDSQK